MDQLDPGHILLDGVLATPRKGHSSPPQFAAHVCCDQTVGWIKLPFGTEVDFAPGHIVLDGDLATPRKGHSSSPLFGSIVYCGQTVAPLSYC